MSMPLLARMRLFEQLQDERFSADAEWQKVVDLAADDPMAWIHRGRWYMQRGEKKQAEADFAKAASLTPDELNKFLEAGWWVAGPYPAELSDSYRPEIDPDPSKPVSPIDLATGVSRRPRRGWTYSTKMMDSFTQRSFWRSNRRIGLRTGLCLFAG